MINVDELRVLLRLQGVDEAKYTDDELSTLIEYYIHLFDTLICFNYRPKEYTDYCQISGSSLLLNHYPIQSISAIIENNRDYLSRIKYVNKSSGIIYFHESILGFITVNYISGFSDAEIEELIKPVIIELIIYGIKYGVNGVITNLKEGDVSVSYDNSMNIQSRIKDLNKRYCNKGRMI